MLKIQTYAMETSMALMKYKNGMEIQEQEPLIIETVEATQPEPLVTVQPEPVETVQSESVEATQSDPAEIV